MRIRALVEDCRIGWWRTSWWWRSFLPWEPACPRTGEHAWVLVDGFPRCERCGL
jgi:hypothetical protein